MGLQSWVHGHLFPCLGVTGAGTGQLASSHRPSICHDTPGKNTAKYCFFISFITLTRLNPEAPLALSGEVLPCPWHPVCPWHKSADCRAPGRGSLACSSETVGAGGARPPGVPHCTAEEEETRRSGLRPVTTSCGVRKAAFSGATGRLQERSARPRGPHGAKGLQTSVVGAGNER